MGTLLVNKIKFCENIEQKICVNIEQINFVWQNLLGRDKRSDTYHLCIGTSPFDHFRLYTGSTSYRLHMGSCTWPHSTDRIALCSSSVYRSNMIRLCRLLPLWERNKKERRCQFVVQIPFICPMLLILISAF